MMAATSSRGIFFGAPSSSGEKTPRPFEELWPSSGAALGRLTRLSFTRPATSLAISSVRCFGISTILAALLPLASKLCFKSLRSSASLEWTSELSVDPTELGGGVSRWGPGLESGGAPPPSSSRSLRSRCGSSIPFPRCRLKELESCAPASSKRASLSSWTALTNFGHSLETSPKRALSRRISGGTFFSAPCASGAPFLAVPRAPFTCFLGPLAFGLAFASPVGGLCGGPTGRRALSRDSLSGSLKLRIESAREKDMRHLSLSLGSTEHLLK